MLRGAQLVMAGVLLAAACSRGGDTAQHASRDVPPAPTHPSSAHPSASLSSRLQAIHGARPCDPVTGTTADVVFEPDGPLRDCLVVTAHQHLRVDNRTDSAGRPGSRGTVQWAGYPAWTVAAGATTTIARPFGSYLAPGFHTLTWSRTSGLQVYYCPGTVVTSPYLACRLG